MATLKIKFLGSISSGNAFKYVVIPQPIAASGTGANAVVASDGVAEAKAAMLGAGIVANANFGDGLGFVSQTHLYSCAAIGAETSVDVRGYQDKNDRQIHWFADIDKVKQANFIDKKKITAEVQSIVNVENALVDAASSLDVEKFEKVRLLKLQQRLLEQQIKNITVTD